MAPLTWRNVDAPNFSGVSDSLRLSASLTNNAFAGLSDVLAKRQSNQQDAASNAFMFDALKYTDSESFNEALRNGTVGAGVDPRLLNKDAINFAAGRTKDLIFNRGQNIQNDTAQHNLERGQVTAQRNDAAFAEQPEAMRRATLARQLMQSGNPEDVARGNAMWADSQASFARAGMSLDDALNQSNQNLAQTGQGITTSNAMIASQDGLEERTRSRAVRDTMPNLLRNSLNADDAIKQVQEANIDTQSKREIIADITANKDVYWGKTESVGGIPLTSGSNAARGAMSTPANGGSSMPSSFLRAVDKTEGGGNYDTLYDNAQRKSTPFSGMKVSNMTVGQAINFAKEGTYGNWVKKNNPKDQFATPMGRHQIVGQTLATAAKQMGLDPNTPFNQQTQDAVATHIAKQAIKGQKTMQGKIAALKGQWDGFNKLDNAELAQVVGELEGMSTADISSAARQMMAMGDQSPSQAPSDTIRSTSTSQTLADTGSVNNSDNNNITIEDPRGGQVTIPTVINGQKVSDEQAKDAYIRGETNAVGTARAAMEGDSLAATSAAANNANITSGNMSTGDPVTMATTNRMTPEDATYAARRTLVEAGQDTMTNQLQSYDAAMASGQFRNMNTAQIVNTLVDGAKDDKGKATGGVLSQVPKEAVTDFINQLMERHKREGITAEEAGYLAQEALESRDIGGSWWGLNPFSSQQFSSGDAYGNPTSGRMGARLDLDKATDLFNNIRGGRLGSGSGAQQVTPQSQLNSRTGRIMNAQERAQLQANLPEITQTLSSKTAELNTIQEQVARNPALAERAAFRIQELQAQIAQLTDMIEKAGGSSTNYTRSLMAN